MCLLDVLWRFSGGKNVKTFDLSQNSNTALKMWTRLLNGKHYQLVKKGSHLKYLAMDTATGTNTACMEYDTMYTIELLIFLSSHPKIMGVRLLH